MYERDTALMRRDQLLEYLGQHRHRSVFWNGQQLFPSEALRLAAALPDHQLAAVDRRYLAVDIAP